MQISYKQIQVGTQVVFSGDGLLFKVLSTALGWVDKDYRRLSPRPWHVGFVSRWHPTLGWMICEATGKGVQENPLAIYDPRYYGLYKWFEKPLNQDSISIFLQQYLGLPYDGFWGYIWITIATLFNKIFHKNIGVWKDDRLLCWELFEEFDEFMEKPICKFNQTSTISDIMKALNGR
jgi:hypothetical protein